MALPATDVTAVPDAAPDLATEPAAAGRRRLRFAANPKAAVGLAVIAVYVLFAIIGPWIAPYDPSARGHDLLQGPSGKHWFGTTHLGQDVFSQVLVGTRGVVFVGFVSALVAVVLSVIIGVSAGYLGGWMEEVLSVLSNVFLVLPGLLLIIIITSAIEDAGDWLVTLIIGLTSWAWGARVLRAQTLSLRQRDYVEAARATGEKTWRVIGFEILPNLTAVIASSFVSTVIYAVMTEITLAFIGIGGGSDWNWGTILFWAQSQQALAQGAWWWFVPAGLAIAILGTALSLVNFGIDEFVNPRLREHGGRRVRIKGASRARMRVGFTPVVRATDATPAVPSARTATTIDFAAKDGDR